MKVFPVKFPLIKAGDDLFTHLVNNLPLIKENSILTLASKIPATCEDRFVPKMTGDAKEKHDLVVKEAEYYLPATSSKYGVMLTVKQQWLFANAGIDESNAENQYLLWPKNPQQTAVKVWQWLKDQYHLKNVGVIITDSRSQPLQWGVVGHGIAFCGFEPLYSYVGLPDLYNRPLKMEKLNCVQALAGVSALVMGEGAERTPVAIFEDLPEQVKFMSMPPSAELLNSLKISLEDDIYAPLLTGAPWQKGGAYAEENEE